MLKTYVSKLFIYVLIVLLLIPSIPPGIVSAQTDDVRLHHDFETSTHGWTNISWQGSATVVQSDEASSEGDYSLKIKDREHRGSGGFVHLTDAPLEVGASYLVSYDMKMAEGEDVTFPTVKIAATGSDDHYYNDPSGVAVTGDGFTTIHTSLFTVPEGLTELALYIEFAGEGEAYDYYIDNVKLYYVSGPPEETPIESPISESVLVRHDFEETTHGWQQLGWGGSLDKELSTEEAFSGDQSLKVTRHASDSKLSLNLTELLTENETYKIRFNIKMASGTDTLRLASKYVYPDTTNEYPWIIGNKEVATEWVTFESGEIDYMPGTSEFIVYIESDLTSDTPFIYYLDDVEILHLTKEDVPNKPEAETMTLIDFESGETEGFVARGGEEVLTVTDEANHTPNGSLSLKVENRRQDWNGPSLDVHRYVDQGELYEVSVWVKMTSGRDELKLSTQVGTGDGASYNNITSSQVTADEWVNLKGTYRYSSLGNGNLSIYVEATSAVSSFYIDDITFTKIETAPIVIEDITPIKDVYQDDFKIGNAVSMSEFEGVRLELLKKHFNLVTAENAMKPSYAYDDEGNFNFDAEHQLVEAAIREGFDIHGHVLVWHEQSRAALYEDADGNPLSREAALNNMYTHIETTMAAFKAYDEHLISWDVVNEAIIDNSQAPFEDWEKSLRQSGWYKAIGPDYLELAFLKARETADALGLDVVLYYNDYNDDQQNKATTIYHMIKDINGRYQENHPGELLIQGMGMQSHYNMNTNPANVRLSMERFIDLGLEIGITELDVTAGDGGVQTDQQKQRQAYIYAELFKLYKEHADHISRITIWGLNDATSWRAAQTPLVFDENLQSKLAYQAIIDPEGFLANYEETQVPVREGTALYTQESPVVDGVEDHIWQDALTLSIDRFQQAWQTATGVAKLLWDDDFLYVLVKVTDDQLDTSSANPWEQDSVELFLDQTNSKVPNYQAAAGIGQYRVNIHNDQSFGSGEVYDGFESAVTVSGTSYTVEMAVPFSAITPESEAIIGFDLQINDGKDGARAGVATWNDTTGQGFQDPSVFGEITLLGERADDIPSHPEPEIPSDDQDDSGETPGNQDKDQDKDQDTGNKPSDDMSDVNKPENPDNDQVKDDSMKEHVIALGKTPVHVMANALIKIKGTKSTIKMPSDLPAGTTLVVDTYEADKYMTTDGHELKVCGDVITVTLNLPDEFLDYTGTFELALGVDAAAENPAIYYLGVNGWERLGGEFDEENGIIRLTVDGFSTYGVFEDVQEANDQVGTLGQALPHTGTMVYNYTLLGLLLLFSGGIFVLIDRKRKKHVIKR
ncbi:hypothetical protein GCM10012290_17660 [Halolactibacillus alkaliphilus]|uniref:Beta-xylanase n=1 Tax=Halolactibacillus alkaliphilus TaxID=442899 RepID=A0A511X2H9_9BACI|nr:endo-1,4-beta-xylanase [Halolactibacillus alkaliphilus]GEN57121.1 hypothetical protein HAL01_15850 [Halolactibacillus alkaliphilus]GGN72067.1 hypothetical protein GCM10012290_17660 [Halolactibacillus alkaliphilus]SFO87824.1 Carbohydrate binding domain-containing protein [Halolactibacillus alkaliphilus]